MREGSQRGVGAALAADLPITSSAATTTCWRSESADRASPAGARVLHRLARRFPHHAELNPQLMQRYRNLDLTYLPAASAFALQDIVPVLGTAKPDASY